MSKEGVQLNTRCRSLKLSKDSWARDVNLRVFSKTCHMSFKDYAHSHDPMRLGCSANIIGCTYTDLDGLGY